MKLKNIVLTVLGTALAVFLQACGGGSSGGTNNTAVTTSDLPVTVIDGPIQNAKVCLDKNKSGTCEADEPSALTDSTGKATIKMDAADSGKFPVVAVVGIDAIDTDRPNEKIATAFTLVAPADKPGVVTPLTTLVHNLMESKGVSSSDAESEIKVSTGIKVSLFEDFTKGSSNDYKSAASIARMVVVTTQQQSDLVKDAVGTTAIDGKVISKPDLEKAIRARLMEILPGLVTALSNLPVGASMADKEAAFKSSAETLLKNAGLDANTVKTEVALNNQSANTSGAVLTNLDQVTQFMALFDKALANPTVQDGPVDLQFADSCYLSGGYTKDLNLSIFNNNPALAGQQNKYRIGSKRTDISIVNERSSLNTDGSKRLELDIFYKIQYSDGTVDNKVTDTLISGSSMGSTMADGSACTKPQVGVGLRFLGNRTKVTAQIRPFNLRNERYKLADGSFIAVDYSKYMGLSVRDPSKIATYAVVTGQGLPTSGVKLLSPLILRDDPNLVGKAGHYVDWKDRDSFRICGLASGVTYSAETADCVQQSTASTSWGYFNKTAATLDGTFNFVPGQPYVFKIFSDDGWKTVNGQAGKSPIASYSQTFERLPYSGVALGGAGISSDLYPKGVISSLTAVQIAANFRNKSAFSITGSWSGLATMPDSVKYGFGDIWTFVSGPTSSTANWPQSRQSLTEYYPDVGQTTITNLPIAAPSDKLNTTTYAEIGVEYTNRNGGWVVSRISFE